MGVCFETNSTFRATNEIAEARVAGRGGVRQARSVPKDYISRLIDAQLSLNEMWIFTFFLTLNNGLLPFIEPRIL